MHSLNLELDLTGAHQRHGQTVGDLTAHNLDFGQHGVVVAQHLKDRVLIGIILECEGVIFALDVEGAGALVSL